MTLAESNGRSAIVRSIHVGPATEPLWLMLGFKPGTGRCRLPRLGAAPVLESIAATGASDDDTAWAVRVSRPRPARAALRRDE